MTTPAGVTTETRQGQCTSDVVAEVAPLISGTRWLVRCLAADAGGVPGALLMTYMVADSAAAVVLQRAISSRQWLREKQRSSLCCCCCSSSSSSSPCAAGVSLLLLLLLLLLLFPLLPVAAVPPLLRPARPLGSGYRGSLKQQMGFSRTGRSIKSSFPERPVL